MKNKKILSNKEEVKEGISNKIDNNTNIVVNNEEDNKKDKNNDSNENYIKALIFCSLTIEKFKKGFNESYTSIKNKNGTLSSLIYNYMKEKNINNLNSIISEVKKKKNEINNEILKNINNEQLIYLSLILTKLHEELNINQLPNSNYLRGDFNEINCLKFFYAEL